KVGLDDLPPITFAATRFLLAVGILFVVIRVQKIPLPNTAKEWRLIALTGVLQFGVNYSMVFWSEQYITSGLAAVLQAMIMVFGQMICALPLITAYSLIVEGNPLTFHWTWRAVICILYLTLLGTIAAFWLYYWLLSKIESTKAMMISLVTPLIAVVIGAVTIG